MALTANRVSKFSERNELERLEVDVSDPVIFEGAILARNPGGTGNLLLGADTASFVFAGIAFDEFPGFVPQDVTTITTDDRKIDVAVPGSGRSFILPIGSTVDATDIGLDVFIVDDETVDLVGVTTNDVRVGTIVNVIDANTVKVRI
ncbi:hypothetical protein LCGC14_0404990 [marine sediment metagenome]|uniref:Uncharacterized protein n=1 Tax=marine sediment metagenome TaxID=412755 RepID=A0A0F9SVE1_9ZZZZ